MSMSEYPCVHRARVNGTFLGQWHGKPVSLLGSILKADGGNSLSLKTSDGLSVNVRLKKSLSEPLTGLMEVHGTGQGKNLVLADYYVHFPEALAKSFDMTGYNEMIGLISNTATTTSGDGVQQQQNPWKP